MNPKFIRFWFLLFLSLSNAAFAQQATKADLQALELKLTNQIDELDQQIDEVDKRLIRLEIIVKEMESRLTNRIDELDKRLTTRIDVLFWAISALIGVVLAVIAVPQLLGYLQGRQERGDMRKIIEEQRADTQKLVEELKTRIEQQQQEIQELKARRIVAPS